MQLSSRQLGTYCTISWVQMALSLVPMSVSRPTKVKHMAVLLRLMCRVSTNGRVAKLSLQLLYIPKPKGAKDEAMPKSMNACIRQLKEAEEIKERSWEGHLSQQGGDCPVST